MRILENPWRGKGLPADVMSDAPMPSLDAAAVRALLARCPVAAVTPLMDMGAFGGAGQVWAKDERGRMGLGSFKALGAAYVIAHAAQAGSLADKVYVTASAGNHGMSVAAGAAAFGAKAVIYLAESVPEGFAERLRGMGAEVVRAGAIYEESMNAAAMAAENRGWTLLSDSSWPGYFDIPHRLMEGYLALAAEAVEQMPEVPSHVFLQAGVGGMAAACAAYFRHVWGDGPRIVVVEPEFAPALRDSIAAGRAVAAVGGVSNMGRLDCKEPSLIALNGLARDADVFMTISEEEGAGPMRLLAGSGAETTPSGGAGLAALLAGAPLGAEARVLCILSEEPEA
jgi:diaminopropionate ammonia-lyase